MEENKKNNVEVKQVLEEKTPDKISKKMRPDILKRVIIGLISFVIIVLIFSVGMFVGGIRARFSYRWAESYHRNFAGPREGFFGNWRAPVPFPGDFIEGHGTFGKIIKIDDSDLVVKGQDDLEKIILITKDTVIEKGRTQIKKEDLKIDEQIVVIGTPNDQGQIEAKLIRVFEEGSMMKLPQSSLPPFFR